MFTRFALLSGLLRLSLRDTKRRIGNVLLLSVIGGFLALVALFCLCLALWLWLCTVTTPLAAAFILAGGAAVLSLIAFLAAAAVGRRRSSVGRAIENQVEEVKASVKAEMAALPPGLPLVGAGLIGLVLGLRLFGK